ncbi:hypothetical protein ACTNEO_14035 [Gracilibacillus sp. HCP3S3_G5_1]|uniref:hypothetical protein n=1 Tax=unclassified Gracilibacillus TaxID=2625209 RepID=UPI003F8A50BD
MKKNNQHQEHLKEQLRKLPKIEDTRSKEEIYQQIETKMHEDRLPSRKKRFPVWIPVIASACAALVIFIVIQGQDFSNNFEQSASETAEDSDMEPLQKFDSNDDSFATKEAEMYPENEIHNKSIDEFHYLIDIENIHPASYMAFLTEKAQHIVPITVLDSTFTYSKMNEVINLEENGLYDIGIRDIHFERENQEVAATFSDSFELPPSERNSRNFDNILSFMFQPLGIEEIKFENHAPILNEVTTSDNLYPISQYEQIPYKLYYNNGEEWFAAKMDGTFKTFTEALEEMKKAEVNFHVQPSIPEDAEIGIEDLTEGQVLVSLASDQIGENQITIQMIEAILATAFTYGYQEVNFDIGIDQVGRYDLTEPLPTTDRINIVQ